MFEFLKTTHDRKKRPRPQNRAKPPLQPDYTERMSGQNNTPDAEADFRIPIPTVPVDAARAQQTALIIDALNFVGQDAPISRAYGNGHKGITQPMP